MTKKEALELAGGLRGDGTGMTDLYIQAMEIDGLEGLNLPHLPLPGQLWRHMHADVIESLAYSYNGDIA